MPVVTTVAHETIPTGEYLAKVTNIEIEDGKFGQQFKWTFLLKVEDDTKELVGWTSVSASLKGKFVKWAGACLGREIEEGEDIDTDDLINCKATAVVLVKTSDKDGSEFNRIDELKVRKSKTAAAGGNGKKTETAKAKPTIAAAVEEDSEEIGADGDDKEDPFEDE